MPFLRLNNAPHGQAKHYRLAHVQLYSLAGDVVRWGSAELVCDILYAASLSSRKCITSVKSAAHKVVVVP